MTPAPELDRTAITPGDWLPGYEMLSVVGAGGFGTVYKARQFKLDRVVAVKVFQFDPTLQPALAARFENEAVTLGRLHHPNIVQVYDYGFHAGKMFIVMELLEGEDLGVRLKAGGKLGERVAWAIARQAASALAHAAGQEVIHRDIKPPNLVLVPSPTGFGLPPGVPLVKVTDFGLARTKWAVNGDDGRLTAPGAVLGTPLYMAPEQYRAAADQDHRVDIYALGATVFHALAGRPPFGGDNIWDMMVQKMEQSPRSWPAISPESIALVEAMMAPDPADRIGGYEDLIARIDALALMHDDAVRSVAPPARRRWRRYAFAAVGSLALAAFGIHIGLPSAPVAAVSRPVLRYKSGGLNSLLDSTSLDEWKPPAAGGRWKFDQDDDRATVLTGTGFTRRAFIAPEDYRITFGLDLHEADAAEVHFGLRAGGQRYVLRVTKDGAIFGAKDGDKAAFRPLGGAVPFPSKKSFGDRRPYLEAQVERAGGSWTARFNGADAGRIADDGSPKLPEVRLFAEGGPARVDSVILEPLERAD
jgi:eukaryotic-like serine/threonine-protein kinase